MTKPNNILLDAEDFNCLIRGGILTIGNIRIALSDIGFDMMFHIIETAILDKKFYKIRKKET